jgi:hypothetical protein
MRSGSGRELAFALVLTSGGLAAAPLAAVALVERASPSSFTGDLRSLPVEPDWRPGDPIRDLPRRARPPQISPTALPESGPDPLLALQRQARGPGDPGFATPLHVYAGAPFTGMNPADPVGDVSREHYIQAVNASGGAQFRVFDKATGAVLSGPTAMHSLGSGVCASGAGDPIVVWDGLAERWFMLEFGSGSNLCVYLSKTGDPILGGWWNYVVPTPSFPDYPHVGVWPNAYVVTTNEADPTIYALERAPMLGGGTMQIVRLTAPPVSYFGFQVVTPADLDGWASPPAGAKPVVARHYDDEADGAPADPLFDAIELWQVDVDWASPGSAALVGFESVAVPDFSSETCGGYTSFSCVPQPPPGTTPKLDPVREPLMYRLAYRNFVDHEALVGAFMSDALDFPDHHSVRWFELRRTGGGPWSDVQDGTYAVDATHRFMGSAAMDGAGDLAIAFNVSSTAVAPGARYAGRLAADPLNTLPQGEYVLRAGTTKNGTNRYGDYTDLTVDPVDDCTFWYTAMYNPASTWSTVVGAVRFDACAAGVAYLFADGFETGDFTRWSATGTTP